VHDAQRPLVRNSRALLEGWARLEGPHLNLSVRRSWRPIHPRKPAKRLMLATCRAGGPAVT
jgi:hypothetical protein